MLELIIPSELADFQDINSPCMHFIYPSATNGNDSNERFHIGGLETMLSSKMVAMYEEDFFLHILHVEGDMQGWDFLCWVW